jgi:hypothetical protein
MESDESKNTNEGITQPGDHEDQGHHDRGVDAVGGRDVRPLDVVGDEDPSDEDDAVGGVDVRDPQSTGGEDQGSVGDTVGGVDEGDFESMGAEDDDDGAR